MEGIKVTQIEDIPVVSFWDDQENESQPATEMVGRRETAMPPPGGIRHGGRRM